MIDPVTGALLAEGLAGLTAGLIGETLAGAWAEHITHSYEPYDPQEISPSIGYGTHVTDRPAITGDTEGSIHDGSSSDPEESWGDYVDQGGSVDPTTGGIVEGSTGDAFNWCLQKVADNPEVLKAVAPVAVPLARAIMAVSKVLGVAMKYQEVDLEVKRKMAEAYTQAGYGMYDEARDLAIAWWDGVRMLLPRSVVEALSALFAEEGIGAKERTGEIDSSTGVEPVYFIEITNGMPAPTAGNPNSVWQCSSPFRVIMTTGNFAVAASKTSQTAYLRQYSGSSSFVTSIRMTSSYTRDGKTIYRSKSTFPASWPTYFPGLKVSAEADSSQMDIIGWESWYGSATFDSDFPEGMEEADSPAYTPQDIPSAGGIATSPSTTVPVVPIALPQNPEDTRGDETDPTTTPTTPEQEEELPAPPIPAPVPQTEPYNPDVPLTDPTVIDPSLVDEIVEGLATTVDPQPPQSSGRIPFPFMPGTPVDPDDPSQGSTYPSYIPTSGSGLIHVYNPTPAEFAAFGAWLWVTYADATLVKIWNNPFDGIIGAHELYSTPSNDGTDNIRSGFLVCPTTAALVRNRYTEFDCGTVIVPEFYGNYFDYSPYSQAYIYLPFIGINEVSIDDIVGHAVNIRYRVDSYNGSCIAMIYVAKSGYRNLCYQFAGNCSVEVPLAGGSQAAIKAGMMQAEAYGRAAVQAAQIQRQYGTMAGAVSGAHSGAGAGALNPVAGWVGGILGAIAGGTSSYLRGTGEVQAAKLQAGAMQEAARYANKSSVQHSGQFGCSHGAMGLKKPFIMIRNPIQVKVVNYNEDYGFPAHKRVIIGGCRGYLRVREVNVISAFATNEEKIAIEENLKAGVYVGEMPE